MESEVSQVRRDGHYECDWQYLSILYVETIVLEMGKDKFTLESKPMVVIVRHGV